SVSYNSAFLCPLLFSFFHCSFYCNPVSPFFFPFHGDPRHLHSSLHDALPIWLDLDRCGGPLLWAQGADDHPLGKTINKDGGILEDRKSTRLNSSHVSISYAVFCLKKKIDNQNQEYDEIALANKTQ